MEQGHGKIEFLLRGRVAAHLEVDLAEGFGPGRSIVRGSRKGGTQRSERKGARNKTCIHVDPFLLPRRRRRNDKGVAMSPRLVPGTIALAALFATVPAAAHDAASGTEALGKVHFQVSCNAAAQKEFDLAMALFHSFAWEQIKAPLDRALQADPTCGMVHWARALASLDDAQAVESLLGDSLSPSQI